MAAEASLKSESITPTFECIHLQGQRRLLQGVTCRLNLDIARTAEMGHHLLS